MTIKKVSKTVCNLYNKEKYAVHIRTLKQALNHGLILKEAERIIKFNQKTWLKPYINMNSKLNTEVINDFERDFCDLMNNSVLERYIKC